MFRPQWLKDLLSESDEPICPEVQSTCIKHRCVRYVRVTGKHPQSGVELDHWDCTHNWLPQLLIENARVGRETAASIDSLRAEVQRPALELHAQELTRLNCAHAYDVVVDRVGNSKPRCMHCGFEP